jgi:predicted nucleotidyltransferase
MKTDFKILINKLTESKVDFVLIGGLAASAYGSTYVTHDLEVCAVLTPGNIEKLRATLEDIHPQHRMMIPKKSFMEIPKDLDGINNLYLSTDAGVLDLISSVVGVGDFFEVSKSAIEISVFGNKCKIISLDDLIKCKKTLKRPKDLLVATELEVIRQKNEGK